LAVTGGGGFAVIAKAIAIFAVTPLYIRDVQGMWEIKSPAFSGL
jgi:hypothetical protein